MSRRVNIDEVAAEERLKLHSIRSALLKIAEVRPEKVIWGETATWIYCDRKIQSLLVQYIFLGAQPEAQLSFKR